MTNYTSFHQPLKFVQYDKCMRNGFLLSWKLAAVPNIYKNIILYKVS